MGEDRRGAVTVLCVGQVTLDQVWRVDAAVEVGHKQPASSVHAVSGGVAANAAVAVARLGGSAILVSCIGTDSAGDQVLRSLGDSGVDTQLVQRVPEVPTPCSAVVVTRDGERTVVNHTPAELFERDAPPLPSGLDAVLVDGRWPLGSDAALTWAREIGVPAVVDVDRHIEDPDRRILGLASHLVFGEDALARFTGASTPRGGLRRAARLTDAAVSVTCGQRGVYWLDGSEVHHLEAFDVRAVDTNGAGDVFHGAFTLALGEGADMVSGFRFASAAAAVRCASGAMPDRGAVDALLAGQRSVAS